MTTYKANSEADVTELALKLSDMDELTVVSTTYGMGLMRFDNLIMRFMMWVIRKIRGENGVRNLFVNVEKGSPDAMKEMFAQVITHCVAGSDREDADSVGGWSQRKIDALCKRLAL